MVIPERVKHAILNLALGGITVRDAARRLNLSVNLTQQAIDLLTTTGQLYQTRTMKKTLYHTIRTFVNRISTPARHQAYEQMLRHLHKHPNRKFPLKELAQQLQMSLTDLKPLVQEGLGHNQLTKKHVGALELYGLA